MDDEGNGWPVDDTGFGRTEEMKNVARNVARMAYNSSPAFAQRALQGFLPGERLFRKYLRELEESQWFSPEQLEELQNEKLRRIVRHAYENVPYYRKIFDERGLKPKNIECKGDLKKLPILTKDDIRRNFKELQANNTEWYEPRQFHTSGSTGIPLKFLLDKSNAAFERATVARSWSWGGVTNTDKQVILRGAVLGEDQYYAFDENNKNVLRLSSFLLNSDTVHKYVRTLNEFSPKLIRGYPQVLYHFCQLLREKRIDCIQPVMLQTSSETLLPFQRKTIESQLRCKVFDFYGNGEHVSAISECKQGGYHVNSEYGLIEFINKAGETTEACEVSEMVCTGLNNFSMPLIRYRIGDTVTPAVSKCPCGRGLPLVKSLEGRLDDVILTPSGMAIPASGMTLAFEYSENIRQCQLVQDTVNELVINIVKTEKYGEKDHSFMLDQVRDRIGTEMKVTVNFVEDIPRTAAGKHQFVISRISREHAKHG